MKRWNHAGDIIEIILESCVSQSTCRIGSDDIITTVFVEDVHVADAHWRMTKNGSNGSKSSTRSTCSTCSYWLIKGGETGGAGGGKGGFSFRKGPIRWSQCNLSGNRQVDGATLQCRCDISTRFLASNRSKRIWIFLGNVWKCLDMFLGIFITAATEGSRNAGNSPKFSRPGGPKDRRIRIQICINGNNNNQSNNQWENGEPRRRRWANQKEGEKKTGAIESLQSFLSASYILYINFSYLKGVAITRTHTIVFVFFMKRIIRRRAENKTKRGKRKREELN